MPRQHPNQDDPISQLAVLSQLFSSLQAPAMRQQEAKQQQALALLGLLQQGSHQDDQIALQRAGQESENKYRNDSLASTGQFHKDELGLRNKEVDGSLSHQKAMEILAQNQAASTDRYHQDDLGLKTKEFEGSLAHQQLMAALAQQQANETAKYHTGELDIQGRQLTGTESHQKALEEQAKLQTQNQMKEVYIRSILSDQTIPQEQKQAALGVIDPMFGKVGDAMGQAKTQAAIQKAAPAFQGVYAAGAKDPRKLKAGLDALHTTLPSDIFNGQDYTTLNAGLPANPSQSFTPEDTSSSGGEAGKSAKDWIINNMILGTANVGIGAQHGLYNTADAINNFLGIPVAPLAPQAQPYLPKYQHGVPYFIPHN